MAKRPIVGPKAAGQVADSIRKGIRLAQQWPKECQCGKKHTRAEWKDLEYGYTMTDEFATMECRNCQCGSTIAVYTKFHDLSKE